MVNKNIILKRQLENILSLISYDRGKTIIEQSMGGPLTPEKITKDINIKPTQEEDNLLPGEIKIPNQELEGYRSVRTPSGYTYIPKDAKYSLFKGDEYFDLYKWNNVEKLPSVLDMIKFLPPGTLKAFTISDGTKYIATPLLGKEFGDLEWGGYSNVKNTSEKWKHPEPEKKESEFDTAHDVLMWTSIIFAAVAVTAATVLSGGALATPLAYYASVISLGADIIDAGIYAYEGRYRDVGLVLILGMFDVYQIMKATKGVKLSVKEVNNIQKKILSNKDEILSGNKKIKDILTEKEYKLVEEISKNPETLIKSARQTGISLSIRALKQYITKSPESFVKSLFLLKTYKMLSGLFLVIDGVQWSYNKLYNLLTSEDEVVRSLTFSLIQYAFSKPEVKNKIEKNNEEIEKRYLDLDTSSKEGLLSTSVEIKDKNIESVINKKIEELRLEKIKQNTLSSGLDLLTREKLNSTPFKNTVEGNEFRKWFRNQDIYKMWSEIYDLDETGPYDNSYIRRAYWLETSGVTAGEEFEEFLQNKTKKTDDEDDFSGGIT